MDMPDARRTGPSSQKKDMFCCDWAWGYTPVIPATWEAEIRRLKVQASLGKKLARLHLNK
jgi:hypothetical protein